MRIYVCTYVYGLWSVEKGSRVAMVIKKYINIHVQHVQSVKF